MEEEMRENPQDQDASDAQREAAEALSYMEGMPRLNIGALMLPPIWGPAKGIWATILWYPFWMFADNCLFAWYSIGDTLSTVFGILTLVLLVVVTVAFSYYSAPYAALRALRRGKTKEQFQRTERIWAVASVIVGIAFIAFATYYNLNVRAPLA